LWNRRSQEECNGLFDVGTGGSGASIRDPSIRDDDFATEGISRVAQTGALRNRRDGKAPELTGNPYGNVLEEEIPLILANAKHVRALPGEKTDNKDGKRLASFLRHGGD
jgi:hypothetical protein